MYLKPVIRYNFTKLDDNELHERKEAPISLKEGLEMTLPGIYAEESAKRGGAVIRIRYPWDAGYAFVSADDLHP